jgi:hypothetical protein
MFEKKKQSKVKLYDHLCALNFTNKRQIDKDFSLS